MGNQASTRTLCIPPFPAGYVTLILSFIPTLLIFPVLIYGLKNSKTIKHALLKYIYWITTFLLLVAAIIWPLHLLFDFSFSGYCDNWVRIATTSRIANVSWMGALISICGLYTVRLYLSFKRSMFPVSKPTLICFAVMIFISTVLAIFVAYFGHSFWIAFTKLDYINMDKSLHLFMILYNTFQGVCILHNIILLVIFVKKINQISSLLESNEREQAINTLVQPVVTYTLCLFMAFISTLFPFVFGMMRGNIFGDSNLIYTIHVGYISTDLLINALSMSLQFDAAKPMFNCLCKYCKNYLTKKFTQTIIVKNTHTLITTHVPLNSIEKSELTQATSTSTAKGVPKLNRE